MSKLQTVYIPTKTEHLLPKITSIPKEKWGVHETHCCFEHGCKYGNEDCPVAIGLTKQIYDCEFCGEDLYPEMTKIEGYVFTPEELKQLLEEYTNRIVNEIGLVKTTSVELNAIDYQPFITDEDEQVWTINKKSITSQLHKFLKEKGI